MKEIDLEEIAKCAEHIKKHVEFERLNDPEIRLGVAYKLPLASCNMIADALEQLPKLVEALRRANQSFDILFKAGGISAPALSIVKQALEPFTLKQNHNDCRANTRRRTSHSRK